MAMEMSDCQGTFGAAADLAAQTQAGSTGGVPNKKWWRMVWCHERCHKDENKSRRQVIQKTCEDFGASLICLRKARQFSVWLERERPPFVLVTDWREAQPCMMSILKDAETTRPVLTMVFCNSQKQVNRASEWARNLPAEAGTVHVADYTNPPSWIMGGMLSQAFGDDRAPTNGCAAMLPKELQGLVVNPLAHMDDGEEEDDASDNEKQHVLTAKKTKTKRVGSSRSLSPASDCSTRVSSNDDGEDGTETPPFPSRLPGPPPGLEHFGPRGMALPGHEHLSTLTTPPPGLAENPVFLGYGGFGGFSNVKLHVKSPDAWQPMKVVCAPMFTTPFNGPNGGLGVFA